MRIEVAIPIAVINNELTKIMVERENTIFDSRFKLSKMPDATFLRDYYDTPDRRLDTSLIKELLSLAFMK